MNTLHISRLGFFVRRQITINIHSFWIALGAIAGILFLISIVVAYFNPVGLSNLQGLYMVVFYFGGLIFTSKIFSELHTPHRSYALLTLPVSNLEKIIGAWLITAPLFILVYLIFIFIITSISSLVAGHSAALVYIFNEDLWRSVGNYLIVHSIFFLGACTFRGNNFLKTLLSMFLFILLISLFAGILGLILFGRFGFTIQEVSPEFQFFLTDVYSEVLKFIFYYLLAPFMLVVSYFKLKERQV